jgi:hypothetical protein
VTIDVPPVEGPRPSPAPLYPRADLGPLAAALAKAQAAFPTIGRDKSVTVQTKSGGSYSFKYAPLDTILSATRGPLTANGLALMQLLDDGALVTSLIHESGAIISGRIDLPQTANIQELGSAVTYLRRYAIQALLGIAAEEDDDGNRAAGNTVLSTKVERTDDGGLVGLVEVGKQQTSDFVLRTDRERGPTIGFRLRGEKGGILVRAFGPLATQLDEARELVVTKRVTAWGRVGDETIPATDKKPAVTYQVLTAERIRVPGLADLPVPSEPAPDGVVGLTEAESEALWTEMDRIGA